MKTILLSLVTVLSVWVPKADASDTLELLRDELAVSVAEDIRLDSVIDWKVGEYQEFDVHSSFGNVGSMRKEAIAEEGNAVWVKAEITGMLYQMVEALYDRTTGQIIEYRENGQPAPIPEEKLEVIREDKAVVTVPAGTFETVHIIARITTRDGKERRMEMWKNDERVSLDGTVQQIKDAGMIVVKMKLKRYGER